MDQIISNVLPVRGAVVSNQGGRPENQDAYCALDTPMGLLVIICDGMGGGPGGKTAADIAKREISYAIYNCGANVSREHAFKMAAARAHEALNQAMKETPALNGMGSTFVALLINKNSAVIAHAGDSRCYQLRGNKCVYRSKDHSLVGELVRSKALTEEEARKSPQANVITRGLGCTSNAVPEIDKVAFKKGDRFILCTDGVWGSMPHPDLLVRFAEQTALPNILTKLSAEVDQIGSAKGGHHDNHTIAIIDVDANSEVKPKGAGLLGWVPADVNWKKTGVIIGAACVLLAVCSLGVWWMLTPKVEAEDFTIGGGAGVGYKGIDNKEVQEAIPTIPKLDDEVADEDKEGDGTAENSDNFLSMEELRQKADSAAKAKNLPPVAQEQPKTQPKEETPKVKESQTVTIVECDTITLINNLRDKYQEAIAIKFSTKDEAANKAIEIQMDSKKRFTTNYLYNYLKITPNVYKMK
ncbi:MAG: protein phosphatase 2C domain-containing protein [Bacteroidales bacterium]|nr:protein phosphatase 2C domain-containing protein [Bacteroidales bacterium]